MTDTPTSPPTSEARTVLTGTNLMDLVQDAVTVISSALDGGPCPNPECPGGDHTALNDRTAAEGMITFLADIAASSATTEAERDGLPTDIARSDMIRNMMLAAAMHGTIGALAVVHLNPELGVRVANAVMNEANGAPQ